MPIGSFVRGVLGGMDWREGRDHREVQRKRDDQRWDWEGEDRQWAGEQRDWAREDRNHAMARRAQSEVSRAAAEAQRRADRERLGGYVNSATAAPTGGFSVMPPMTGGGAVPSPPAPFARNPVTGSVGTGAAPRPAPAPQASGGYGPSAALRAKDELLATLRGVA